MSFVRVNGSSWNLGDKLTSSQANQLDIDHANALDKTGDSITGAINFAVGASFVVNISGGLTATAQWGIRATSQFGIMSSTVGGISTTVAGGIADGVAGGITVSQPNGMAVIPGSGQNGILIQSNNSWVGYQVPRVITRAIALANGPPGTGWTATVGSALLGPATSNVTVVNLNGLVHGVTNGAKLTGATLVFAVANHASVPATLPTFNINRFATAPGSSTGATSLYSTGTQTVPTPGSGAAWYSSGNMQNFATTPDQNNTIDFSQYTYSLSLEDENGANSVAGNAFYCVILTFTNILNSAPG